MSLLLWLSLFSINACISDPTSDLSISDNPRDFSMTMTTSLNSLRASGLQCGGRNYPSQPELQWNEMLAEAANAHAQDMSINDFFDHKGSDGTQASQRVDRTGYNWSAVGENIAIGHTSIAEVIAAWKHSPQHCHIMMNEKYRDVGAAHVGKYWVIVFGKEI